jgi:hypothetical protein
MYSRSKYVLHGKRIYRCTDALNPAKAAPDAGHCHHRMFLSAYNMAQRLNHNTGTLPPSPMSQIYSDS